MPKKKASGGNEAALAARLPGETEVDSMLVNEAVHDLNRLYVAKGLETARVIGEYVIERFFGGRLDNFEQASGEHESFQALSDRDDLQVSKSFLWYAVRLLPQLQQLPENIATALPLSHHRLLLHVGDEKLKNRLAKKAVEKSLSKREFEEEVRKARKKAGTTSKAGRPALPAFQKTIHRFVKVLEKPDEAFAELDQVDKLSEDEARKLYQAVTGMKLKCEELQEKLKDRAGM